MNLLHHWKSGFFPESETESKVKFAFKSNADKMRDDFRFGMSSNPDVLAEYGYSEYVVVVGVATASELLISFL